MPRILRIINRLNLGGPTYNAAYLSKYLSPGFHTMLLAGMKDDTEESSEYIVQQMELQPVYITDMKRELSLFSDWKAYWQIRRIIKDFKPDIVHTHAAKAGTLGRLAASHLKVPVILHTFHGHVFHSYFGRLKTIFFLMIERYLASKSTAIIAISEIQKKELADKFKICKDDKIKIVPLGFDLARFWENQDEKRKSFRKQFLIDDDELAIGIIGRLVPVKNHELFLEAVARLKNKTSRKFKAIIIGDGESRLQLEKLCTLKGLSITDHISTAANTDLIFTSWVKNVDWALAGLDIIALTSLNEGTPVSLVEAQAAGKPVVSTEVGGIADIVIRNETALLSGSTDVASFSQNLLLLVENDELRKKMSVKGRLFVEQRFHYTRLVDEMKEIYEQLLCLQT